MLADRIPFLLFSSKRTCVKKLSNFFVVENERRRTGLVVRLCCDGVDQELRGVSIPQHLLVCLLVALPVLPLLRPRNLGISLEHVAIFAEERDHLPRKRCIPAATEVIITEPIAATRARRERQSRTAVSTVELCEAASSTLELVPYGMVERHL